MLLKQAFAIALKHLRKTKHCTQEDFYDVSSRTYISALERGLKSPTLDKLEDIASVLQVHPATLVLAAYMEKEGTSMELLFERIREDLKDLT
jgi:transcriptional regulator with XRE-family HTH domain